MEIAELLAQQLAGGGNLEDSIGRLVADDPRLAPVADLLAQREQQRREELEQQEQEEELERREAELRAERRSATAELRERFEGVVAEVGALRDQLGEVAAALGACPACFGADTGCPWCRGRGRPGFMPPDPDGFDRLVVPALRLHVRLSGRRITEVADRATRERSTP